MDYKKELNQYYSNYNEDGRLLSRVGNVEFVTTVKYINKYLKPGMRILEIGAATGRYSHYFARQGYTVDAIELLEHNINIFKENTLPEEDVRIYQGDARNLSDFASNIYDITLVFGPMYHLYTDNERKQALSEAIRLTKKNGIIFVAYCMLDASMTYHGFRLNRIHKFIERGEVDPETFKTYTKPQDLFAVYRKEEIDSLRSNFNVEQLHFVAADGYAKHMTEALNTMDNETYELFLKYHFSTCERQDMIGLSHHTIDIFRKNDWKEW